MKYTFLFFSLLFLNYTGLNAQTYPEVWFDNSNLPLRYSNSLVHYEGDSWVKNRQNQLPVVDSIFFTPHNALELKYTSAEKGTWTADIFYSKGHLYKVMEPSVFSFKLLVKSQTDPTELPALEFIQADSLASSVISLKKYIREIDKSDWVSVEIPLQDVTGLQVEGGILGIRFLQNATDGKEHRLIIDQIEFLPEKYPRSRLTSAAVLSSAIGYERHVDLTWTLPFTPSIRYVKIYRSQDNKNFHPVGIRPVFVKKYSDIVPEQDESYFYKVSWVDYQYRESPLSNVMEAKTRKLSDSELLEMVQNSSISYFIDGEEFNSGMQLRNGYAQHSIVSVKNTAIGLMALISEVKEDPKAHLKLFNRLEKIISFLERSEQKYGVFPELLDGRTAKSVGLDSTELVVDLESTGQLMQSLLVAKEFFGQNSEVERQLAARIDHLWRAVEWRAFLKEGKPYLMNRWSSQLGLDAGTPLSGMGKLYLYILAIASPEFSIELDTYHEVVLNPLKVRTKVPSISESGLTVDEDQEDQVVFQPIGLEYYVVPYVNEHYYYGIRLAIGQAQDPLEEILQGFIALDPRRMKDDYADYYQNIKNLIHIQARQSEELNAPFDATSLLVSNGIAIFPFDQALAVENMRTYYRNHAETLWTEYGFVRSIDFQQNKIIYPKHDFENALNTVMINNGKNGLIWDLFSQVPAIKNVLEVLYKK